MRKLISFIERTPVESALTLAVLVSLAWVFALAFLLRTLPTHSSVEPASSPPLQHAAPSPRPGSSSN
jgi:hypothetical protein